MSWKMFPSFQFSERICIELILLFFLNAWWNSPVKPYGPGNFSVRRFVTKNLISLIRYKAEMCRLSVSSWVNSESLCLPSNLPISLSNWIYLSQVVCNISLSFSLLLVGFVVMCLISNIGHLFLVVLFPYLSGQRSIILVHLFKYLAFGFIDLYHISFFKISLMIYYLYYFLSFA